MPPRPKASRGQPITAELFNKLGAWVESIVVPGVGPGLKVSQAASGAWRLALIEREMELDAVIVTAPDPATPIYPEDCEYTVRILGNPSSEFTGKPGVGRPAVGREVKIWPARRGARAKVIRSFDTDGEPTTWFYIPPGGEDEGSTAGPLGWRGERLTFAACEEDLPPGTPGSASDGADGVDVGASSQEPVGSRDRTMSSFYSSGEPGASPPGMIAPGGLSGGGGSGGGSYGVATRLPVQLAVIDTTAVGQRERIEIPRASGGRLAGQAIAGTWASTLSVVYYTGPIGPLAFSTPKTLTAAAPTVTFSADDLNGVTAIEVVGPASSPDGAGTRVRVGGAFELVVPSGMPGALALPAQVAG